MVAHLVPRSRMGHFQLQSVLPVLEVFFQGIGIEVNPSARVRRRESSRDKQLKNRRSANEIPRSDPRPKRDGFGSVHEDCRSGGVVQRTVLENTDFETVTCIPNSANYSPVPWEDGGFVGSTRTAPSTNFPNLEIDILAAVKRTAIPHHATFLEWSLNGVDATRDAASLTEVLRFPTRPFKVSECPPATLIFTAAFTSRS